MTRKGEVKMTLMSSQTVTKHCRFLQQGFLCDSSLKKIKRKRKYFFVTTLVFLSHSPVRVPVRCIFERRKFPRVVFD